MMKKLDNIWADLNHEAPKSSFLKLMLLFYPILIIRVFDPCSILIFDSYPILSILIFDLLFDVV